MFVIVTLKVKSNLYVVYYCVCINVSNDISNCFPVYRACQSKAGLSLKLFMSVLFYSCRWIWETMLEKYRLSSRLCYLNVCVCIG